MININIHVGLWRLIIIVLKYDYEIISILLIFLFYLFIYDKENLEKFKINSLRKNLFRKSIGLDILNFYCLWIIRKMCRACEFVHKQLFFSEWYINKQYVVNWNFGNKYCHKSIYFMVFWLIKVIWKLNR